MELVLCHNILMIRKGRLAFGVAGFVVISWLCWKWFLSPEADISNTVSAIVYAAESSDTEQLLSHFSQELVNQRLVGGQSVGDFIRHRLSMVDRLDISLEDLKVDVVSNVATTQFDMVVSALKEGERYLIFGTPFQPVQIKALFIKDGSTWKLSEAVEFFARESQE